MAKCLALTLLLGVLLAPILAEESVSLVNKGKDGKDVHHTLVINKEQGIAIQHVGAGRQSVTAIIDYKTGIIAYRAFESQSCFIVRMDRATFPPLDKLRQAAEDEKSQKKRPPPPGKQYNVNPEPIKDLSKLGAPVQAMCHDLPTHWAQEQIGEMFFFGESGKCFNLNLLFLLNINMCRHSEVHSSYY
ncbi:gastrokine-1-like [Lepisosteus oculatus]